MDFSLALGLASGARAVAGEDRYDDDDDYEDPLAYSSAYSSPAYRPPRRRRGAPSEDEDDDQDDDDDDDDDDDSEAVHSDSSLSYSQYASANPSPEKGLVTTVQQRSDGKLARALALLTRGAYQHYSMEAAAADTVDSVHSLRAANEKLWNEVCLSCAVRIVHRSPSPPTPQLKSTEAQRAALEDENRAMRVSAAGELAEQPARSPPPPLEDQAPQSGRAGCDCVPAAPHREGVVQAVDGLRAAPQAARDGGALLRRARQHHHQALRPSEAGRDEGLELAVGCTVRDSWILLYR